MKQEKKAALELMHRLSEDVTTADIVEELYFKAQVDKGLRDVAEGRVMSHDALKKRMAKWQKSAG